MGIGRQETCRSVYAACPSIVRHTAGAAAALSASVFHLHHFVFILNIQLIHFLDNEVLRRNRVIGYCLPVH
jgi:hypothetical protein